MIIAQVCLRLATKTGCFKMCSLITQRYWLQPSQQSTCQLAHAPLKVILFQKFTNRDLVMYRVLNLQQGFNTLLLSLMNLLSRQLWRGKKNTEYKRTSKDEHRQLLVSPSRIIPAEPKLQSWQGRGLWRV